MAVFIYEMYRGGLFWILGYRLQIPAMVIGAFVAVPIGWVVGRSMLRKWASS
jgi:hypothetical protein